MWLYGITEEWLWVLLLSFFSICAKSCRVRRRRRCKALAGNRTARTCILLDMQYEVEETQHRRIKQSTLWKLKATRTDTATGPKWKDSMQHQLIAWVNICNINHPSHIEVNSIALFSCFLKGCSSVAVRPPLPSSQQQFPDLFPAILLGFELHNLSTHHWRPRCRIQGGRSNEQ